jgi:uncharacterized protein (DUF1786 family)
MQKLEQRVLRNDVQLAEKRLSQVAARHGKSSPEYREALQRFARLWSVLKMTRSQEEFLTELKNVSPQSR